MEPTFTFLGNVSLFPLSPVIVSDLNSAQQVVKFHTDNKNGN